MNFCQCTKNPWFGHFWKNNDQNRSYVLLQLFVYKNLPLELLFPAIHIFDKTMGLKVLALCRNMLKKSLFTLNQLFVYNIVLHVKPLKIAKYVHSKIMCNAHTYLQRDSFSRLLKKTTTIFTKYEKNVLKCAICRLLDIIFFLCHDGITVLMHLILKAASKSGFLSSTTLYIFHNINTKYAEDDAKFSYFTICQ